MFSINDLKREGSAKLPPMYRGLELLRQPAEELQADSDQTIIMKELWTWKREFIL